MEIENIGDHNVYLAEVKKLGEEATLPVYAKAFQHNLEFGKGLSVFTHRERMTKKYAWAIPNAAAIQEIAKHSPLIEIGAGTGLWANLIQRAGGDIKAFDLDPGGRDGKNDWHDLKDTYFPVEIGGAEKIEEHLQRTLLLCWPPYDGALTKEALDRYVGQVLLYVGEWDACTGWDARLGRGYQDDTPDPEEWEVKETVDIPQWWGIHDRLYVFERKGNCGNTKTD